MEWGYRTEAVGLGAEASHHCEACGRQQPFSLLLRYQVSYFWDPALCWVSRRDYLSVCGGCRAANAADPKTAMAGSKSDPIPWKSRHGLAVGLAAMALVGLLVRLFIGWAEQPHH